MAKTIGILELNDFQMQLSLLVDGKLQAPVNTCGYSTINSAKQEIIFGQEAQAQFRRQPLNSFNQYWNQLNVEPINANHNKIRHYADLAHQQLLALHGQDNFDELILVVPASFNREKLSLLLGICGQCPFEVIGLVDSAVIGSSNMNASNTSASNARSKILHLDIQLHQCILTHLSQSNGSEGTQTQIKSVDIIPGTGISQLYTRFAHYLSEQFIEQCRFDPIHNADSEQQLYNLLGQLINGEQSAELQLSLDGKQVTLNRQSIWRHASDLFDELSSTLEKCTPFDSLIVHQRITALDGLYAQLNEKFAGKIQVIEQQNIAANVVTNQSQVTASDKGLQYTTCLIKDRPNKDRPSKEPQFTQASHIVINEYAYPIGEQTIYFGSSCASTQRKDDSLIAIDNNQSLSILNGSKVEVNGQTASNNQTLNLGDSLTVNGQHARLINVLTSIELKGQS